MKIILSPAKKMKEANDDFSYIDKPVFLKEAKYLYECLSKMQFAELKEVWQCSDKLVQENQERLKQFSFDEHLSPALFTYIGLAYQHIAADVMEESQLDYLQKHLRILSGFYGVLKPFDGISPYRLEMQAKFPSFSLYDYWKDRIYQEITREEDCIINLASKEYSQCIEAYLKKSIRYITCVFAEEKNGKIIQKGTMAKMARGDMVAWMSEEKIEEPEQLKDFAIHYHFEASLSNEREYVFLRG
ncbi:MAG: peroxide stress protein YaaA [Solobacterium sp.]|nr:peroxide stress protein YaaA [Solobacterium sp.]